MFIGMIRPTGTYTVDVTGTSLEDVQAQLETHRKDGFELTLSPAAMVKGAALIKTTGTFQRRDELRDIEADTIDGVRERVPDGWHLLSIRKA